MEGSTIALIVGLVLVVGLTVGLYFWGKKALKKQDEQRELLQQNKQYASMLLLTKSNCVLKIPVYHRLLSTRLLGIRKILMFL